MIMFSFLLKGSLSKFFITLNLATQNVNDLNLCTIPGGRSECRYVDIKRENGKAIEDEKLKKFKIYRF